MKKISISRWPTLFVLFAFLFNACSTSTQSPTATISPTQTYAATETSTPEPTATQTETAISSNTPTPQATGEAVAANPESVDYTAHSAEQYKSNVIPYADLFNGNYQAELDSIPVNFSDPSDLNIVKIWEPGDGTLVYGEGDELTNSQKSPVKIGIDYGYTQIQQSSGTHVWTQEWAVVGVAFVDPNKPNQAIRRPFIIVNPGLSENEFVSKLKALIKTNGLVIVENDYFWGAINSKNTQDPLVVQSETLHPTMFQDLANFKNTADPNNLKDGEVFEALLSQ